MLRSRSRAMKHLLSILCLLLIGCSTPAPEPVQPIQTRGEFKIIEYAMPGTIKRTWTVKEYHETEFPRTVTFVYGGETITLRGSYQISEFLP